MMGDQATVYTMPVSKVKEIKDHPVIVSPVCISKKRLANIIEVKYVLSGNQVTWIINEHEIRKFAIFTSAR